MKIETISDFNALAVGCGCCPLEIDETPPVLVGQSIDESQSACYYTEITENGGTGRYRRVDRTITKKKYNTGGGVIDSGGSEQYFDERWDGSACTFDYDTTYFDPISSPDLSQTRQESTLTEVGVPPDDYTRTSTIRYYRFPNTGSEYLYWEDTTISEYSEAYQDMASGLLAELEPRIDALTFPDDITGTSKSSLNWLRSVTVSDDLLTLRKARYRWEVDPSFTGVYLKVTWDVLDEPTGWNDPSSGVSRSFYQQDLTWEWEDGDDEESAWYDIPFPDIEGNRRIVNIRFLTYRSTQFGAIPIATGESISDDEL